MQAQVKEMYLKIIDATIDNARLEFTENGAEEATLGNLETLKARWVQRLLATQDFTDDPAMVRASSGGTRKRTATGAAGEPANKRSRQQESDIDEGEPLEANPDLGSSGDDTDESDGSDPEVDNYILAHHDRVRKGTTGEWKVHLKEGVAHINGRDYLFNKGVCDLDFYGEKKSKR